MLTLTPVENYAVSDFDPFSDESLLDPFEDHKKLRAAGSLVWLEKYGIWCAALDRDINTILMKPEIWSSEGGAGLANYFKQKPWRQPSLLLETDPPLHTRSRQVVARTMSPLAMKKLREDFHLKADQLVEPLTQKGKFDAVTDIAEVFPLTVFPEALGIVNDGGDLLLRYAALVFAGFGPENAFYHQTMADAPRVLPWIEAKCERGALRPGSFGSQIYDAVDAGEIPLGDAPLLIRSFLSAGLDTTISGLGTAIHCLANNPDQWDLLKSNPPAFVRAAFEEAVRLDPPVWALFRTALEDTEYGGVRIQKHQKVILLLASANRDESRWSDPEKFDITRKTAGHHGFGAGIHGCVGQMVAKMEGEAILSSLAKRVSSFEFAAPPVRRLSTGLRAFASIPISVKPS